MIMQKQKNKKKMEIKKTITTSKLHIATKSYTYKRNMYNYRFFSLLFYYL